MKYLGKELEKFSNQITYALDNYSVHNVKRKDIDSVIIAGLGGSGIAGKIVKNYFFDKIDFPLEVVSDYILPYYANERTLVILSSYSGSTEETLTMYDSAKAKGCPRIVLSTGGEIVEKAKRDNVKVYGAEKGFQPRAALGYSLTNLFMIFFEMLGQSKEVDLRKIANSMSNVDDFKSRTKKMAEHFKQTIRQKYILVCDPVFEGLTIRFAQQIQENAKLEAFVSVLPEANHNMLETYYEEQKSNFVFINSGSNQRTNLRFHFLENHLKSLGNIPLIIDNKGPQLDTFFEVIFILDWISVQVADMVGAISNTVPNIMKLKDYLSSR